MITCNIENVSGIFIFTNKLFLCIKYCFQFISNGFGFNDQLSQHSTVNISYSFEWIAEWPHPEFQHWSVRNEISSYQWRRVLIIMLCEIQTYSWVNGLQTPCIQSSAWCNIITGNSPRWLFSVLWYMASCSDLICALLSFSSCRLSLPAWFIKHVLEPELDGHVT